MGMLFCTLVALVSYADPLFLSLHTSFEQCYCWRCLFTSITRTRAPSFSDHLCHLLNAPLLSSVVESGNWGNLPYAASKRR
uniref:Putative secreted protein n=1 Tax=Anopheles triannulatus TaxID=58253 RepID=A0A2M4B593_9DIPT